MAKTKASDGGVDFKQIVAHCTDLKNQYTTRDADNEEYEKEYLMDWTEDKPTDEDAKITISPDGHNAILGVDRLLSSTSPKFSVPVDKSDESTADKSDELEKFANALWYINGRIRQSPLEGDLVHSGALYGEFAAGIISTKDLLDQAQGGSKASIARMERIAEMTPILFEVYDVNTCYPEFDFMGLTTFYRQTTVKSGVIIDAWGQIAIDSGIDTTDRFADIVYCDYWDNNIHASWIEGKGTPLFIGEHGLPRIPIVDQITDGSMIHTKPEQQRHAFLYGLVKSKLSKRQSLALTVMYSNIFKHGINPQMVYKALDKTSADIIVDKANSGTIIINQGESYDPLQQQVIDRSLMEISTMAERKGEESTIYKQAMGGNIASSNAAYSTIALLNQAGRLPLVSIQKRAAWGMGQMMEIAFAMINDGKAGTSVKSDNGVMKIKTGDIPKNVMFEVKLDVDLPMDERQNVQTADQMVKSGLASKRHVREKILNLEQSAMMEKEIAKEMVSAAMLQAETQKQIQQIMAKAQQEMQAGMQQGQPAGQPQGLPSNMAPQPQSMPPEMQGQSAQAGLPMSAPMDLQQMQGGDVPPEMGMPNG